MRVRATAAALAALLALGAAGCLSGPALVPQSFTIDPPAHRSSSPSSGPPGVVVALGRVEVAPPYSGQSLVFRTGDHDLKRDPYARLAAPPARLLAVAIGGYLANADFVRDVVVPGDDLRSVATIEVTVGILAGELRSSGSSASLALRFRVLARPGGVDSTSEILLKSYSSTLPISRATAQDVVGAWNRGLADIMAEFETDLKASLVDAQLLSSGPALVRDTPRPAR
jgi:hypothetical protein